MVREPGRVSPESPEMVGEREGSGEHGQNAHVVRQRRDCSIQIGPDLGAPTFPDSTRTFRGIPRCGRASEAST